MTHHQGGNANEMVQVLPEGITPQFNILYAMMRSGEQVPSSLQTSVRHHISEKQGVRLLKVYEYSIIWISTYILNTYSNARKVIFVIKKKPLIILKSSLPETFFQQKC